MRLLCGYWQRLCGFRGGDFLGRASARKGARGEREILRYFRERGYDPQRAGTQTFGTVPDVYNVPGLHLEVKRCETLRIPQWIRQSERDAEAFLDGTPTVVFRQNGQPWRIVMRLDDFLQYYVAVHPPDG